MISLKKNSETLNRYQINGFTQGTKYQITYYSRDSIISKHKIDSILKSVDTSMSLYIPSSLISRFNACNYGIAMDEHIGKVVEKSIETSIETDGYFDITVAPLVSAWGFGAIKKDTLPDKATVKSLKKCIGTHNLIIRNDSLIKRKPCIQIDLNGIAQGYTVDLIADYLTLSGISDFLVEIGGEIRTQGRKQPGNVSMKIGIEAPSRELNEDRDFQKIISLENGAITTSGNYRRYQEYNGGKISHHINPFTGYPTVNELISVTVWAKTAITADAYDNALMIMGLKRALTFAERRKDIGAYFIYRKRNGQVADTCTSKFRELISQN